MRKARVERRTGETDVVVDLTIDGSGETSISTGVPFFDHMLSQLGRHAGFDLEVKASGDLESDPHHTVEGEFKALGGALGDACAPSGRGGMPSTKGVLE